MEPIREQITTLINRGFSIETIEEMLKIKIFTKSDPSMLFESVLNGDFTFQQLLID
jgi:DNA-binding transcriptional MerR regulator